MRADIVTMNAAFSDVFCANLPKAICETYEPIPMKQPNTVFLHTFDWFITKYGKTRTEDREESRQRLAADWHPSDGFEHLVTCLFIGSSYASAACYPMDNHGIIDIGLHIIKQCGMYSKEYKIWINRENETIDSFKEYCANGIALVNQTVSQPCNMDMVAMDEDASIALYSESLANFDAAYTTTQESMKTQATTMAAMQGQLTNIQQFCMAVGQQPPPNIYAPAQQQHMFNNRRDRCNGGDHGNDGAGGGNGGGSFPQQPA